MRSGAFPVDDEAVIDTLARMHAAAGEARAAILLRTSRCASRRRPTTTGMEDHDLYALCRRGGRNLQRPSRSREDNEKLILSRLRDATKQFREHWYVVELAPVIVSMPGRHRIWRVDPSLHPRGARSCGCFRAKASTGRALLTTSSSCNRSMTLTPSLDR